MASSIRAAGRRCRDVQLRHVAQSSTGAGVLLAEHCRTPPYRRHKDENNLTSQRGSKPTASRRKSANRSTRKGLAPRRRITRAAGSPHSAFAPEVPDKLTL